MEPNNKNAIENTDNSIIKRYGSLKQISYLITSLSDLKETVDTIKGIIETGCEEKDILRAAENIEISCTPLKNSLSSFILGLNIPYLILHSKYKHNLDKLQITFNNSSTSTKIVGQKTIFRYKLNNFYDLILAITQFFTILGRIAPRIEFFNIKKNTIVKAGKINNSTDTILLFISPFVLKDPAILETISLH